LSDRGGLPGADAWGALRDYRAREEHRIVGLMTGTSADAIDAALVRFQGLGMDSKHEVEAYQESSLEPALRNEILEVAAAETLAPERLMRLDAALGERHAAAVLELLAEAGRAPDEVDAIGMHGQTVRHVPRSGGRGRALTLQLGSAAEVAERTGIAVVSDFRSRDTAAGGEGAPLVPLVDWWLFRSPAESRVLLNLGGMANATYLPRGGGLEAVLGFDTGPGNALLDALMSSGPVPATFDEGGAMAARGRISSRMLAECLEDSFFRQPPPRSTGRERFGRAYADGLRERGLASDMSEEDVLATAVALTAAAVAQAIERFLAPRGVDAVYVSGGGVRNATLMRALVERLAPIPVRRLESLGANASGKEALAFAFLAHQTLAGLPGNVPGATGAARAVVLGHLTPGGRGATAGGGPR
jgi:anhydro-N-acetylmuramic acid kinase